MNQFEYIFFWNFGLFYRNFLATGSRCKKAQNYFQVCMVCHGRVWSKYCPSMVPVWSCMFPYGTSMVPVLSCMVPYMILYGQSNSQSVSYNHTTIFLKIKLIYFHPDPLYGIRTASTTPLYPDHPRKSMMRCLVPSNNIVGIVTTSQISPSTLAVTQRHLARRIHQ